jgi:hypothetical protein
MRDRYGNTRYRLACFHPILQHAIKLWFEI